MNSAHLEAFSVNSKQFHIFSEILLRWNQKINLTAITSPDEVNELHFIDSLFLLPEIVSRETLLDLGSGCGLPGLALKIARPDLSVTLVDSVKKKCDFMKAVVRALGLKKVEVIHQRVSGVSGVSGVSASTKSIGPFDAVVSRAAFKMVELIRLAIPHLGPHWVVIGMKGAEVSGEIEACQGLIQEYEFSPIREVPYTLPFSQRQRKLLIAEK